jgi:hypothetical protein
MLLADLGVEGSAKCATGVAGNSEEDGFGEWRCICAWAVTVAKAAWWLIPNWPWLPRGLQFGKKT